NKARRGELALRLPVGLVRLPDGRCARDPDAGIQTSIAAAFNAFAATGTIAGTVRHLLACEIRFPQVIWGGEKAGTITWCDYNRPPRDQHSSQSSLCRRLCVWASPLPAGARRPHGALQAQARVMERGDP